MKHIELEILKQQKSEITEHYIYSKLAKISRDEHNKEVLKQISNDELNHHNTWHDITKKKVKPSKWKIYQYSIIAKLLGLTFALRFMERNEVDAQEFYNQIAQTYPQAKKIQKDEIAHEQKLISMLKDNKLEYAGAVVLGLNDALVELTGTLAGLALAFSNTKIIGTTGLIMGVAAALSMAASGYMSFRENENTLNPITASIYTGIAYIITVLSLVTPYFLIDNVYYALGTMFIITIIIIAAYTSYISIAKKLKFRKRFSEMAMISLGVALISFGIGYLVKIFFGIDL